MTDTPPASPPASPSVEWTLSDYLQSINAEAKKQDANPDPDDVTVVFSLEDWELHDDLNEHQVHIFNWLVTGVNTFLVSVGLQMY